MTLKRVQTFLDDTDIAYLTVLYGYGWSSHIRDIVHQWIVTHSSADQSSADPQPAHRFLYEASDE